jgi:hypothetical protein
MTTSRRKLLATSSLALAAAISSAVPSLVTRMPASSLLIRPPRPSSFSTVRPKLTWSAMIPCSASVYRSPHR